MGVAPHVSSEGPAFFWLVNLLQGQDLLLEVFSSLHKLSQGRSYLEMLTSSPELSPSRKDSRASIQLFQPVGSLSCSRWGVRNLMDDHLLGAGEHRAGCWVKGAQAADGGVVTPRL